MPSYFLGFYPDSSVAIWCWCKHSNCSRWSPEFVVHLPCMLCTVPHLDRLHGRMRSLLALRGHSFITERGSGTRRMFFLHMEGVGDDDPDGRHKQYLCGRLVTPCVFNCCGMLRLANCEFFNTSLRFSLGILFGFVKSQPGQKFVSRFSSLANLAMMTAHCHSGKMRQ